MKRAYVVLGAILMLCNCGAFATPQNLSVAKQKVKRYVASGRYMHDMTLRYARAQRYLAKRIRENNASRTKKKLAVVLDIDETLLSNYPDMVKADFGGTMSQMDRVMAEAHDRAFAPARRFYHYAVRHNVAVFFVTGRNEFLRAATVKNLRKAGCTTYRRIYMLPNHVIPKTVIPFKSAMRRRIEKQGYDVVLTIGDQYSDIKGGYADKGVKLPDPFYYIA